MEQQVLTYVRKLKKTDVVEDVVELLCRGACGRLDSLLADRLRSQDCRESELLAGAWVVLDWLEE